MVLTVLRSLDRPGGYSKLATAPYDPQHQDSFAHLSLF